LNNITPYFFDAIKLLEGADEIIMIDSVWSVVCYLLDCKYKLFNHIKITIYCVRDYAFFFDSAPANWTIIEKQNIPVEILFKQPMEAII